MTILGLRVQNVQWSIRGYPQYLVVDILKVKVSLLHAKQSGGEV